jgi:hypothetical protein
VFRQDLRRLFQTTAVFCDAELGAVNRCLLAAAGAIGPGNCNGPEQIAAMLQAVPVQVATAVKDLVHCQEIALCDESSFFSLFSLVGKMKIKACEEVCQDAVSSLAYKEKPIRLQLSTAHVQAMQTQCHEWQRTGMTPFADATILLKNPDADGTPEWKQVRVHAVLFAASCEYLRGQPV